MSKKKKHIIWGVVLGTLAIGLALFVTIKVLMSGFAFLSPDPVTVTETEEMTYLGNHYVITSEVTTVENPLDMNIWDPSNVRPLESTITMQKNDESSLSVDVPHSELYLDYVRDVIFEDEDTLCIEFSWYGVCAEFDNGKIYHYTKEAM